MTALDLMAQLPDALETPPRKRFTREEVERLLDTGVFDGQRFELIDGDLIDKMGQKPPHAAAIQRIGKWLRGFVPDECVRVQLPIELSGEDRNRSIPEPDIAVVAQLTAEHERRHPNASELLLSVEVAESSAAFDLGRKAALYAGSGVSEYWVVDLKRRMLVVHRRPEAGLYRSIQMFSENDAVSLEHRSEAVRLAELLPPQAS